MRKLSLLAVALPLVLGCRANLGFSFHHSVSPTSNIPATEAAKALAIPEGQTLCNGVNGLGFGMLRSLSRDQTEKNICISPASVYLAVGMTLNGAKEDTQRCISQALGVYGMKETDFAKGCLNLAALFENSDPKMDVNIANSIWAMPEVELKSDFLNVSRQYYDAEVSNADLSSTAGLNLVNGWVKEKTKGKIPSILDQSQAGAAMVLLDAIYFKGLWDTPFDTSITDQEPFHLANGTTKTVAMMGRTSSFQYVRSGTSQLLSVPYKSQHLAMLIYLPDEDTPLPEVIGSANAQSWARGLACMSQNLVSLRMPKFSVSFSASLKQALSAAGMSEAFEPGVANFKGISDSKLFISDVLHKTTTDVDEQGTVATAATAVVMGVTSAGPPAEPPKPIEFIADHPFLYAIYDTTTKAILFVGVMYDP